MLFYLIMSQATFSVIRKSQVFSAMLFYSCYHYHNYKQHRFAHDMRRLTRVMRKCAYYTRTNEKKLFLRTAREMKSQCLTSQKVIGYTLPLWPRLTSFLIYEPIVSFNTTKWAMANWLAAAGTRRTGCDLYNTKTIRMGNFIIFLQWYSHRYVS